MKRLVLVFSCLVAASCSSNEATTKRSALDSTLVAAYNFDEGSGTVLHDVTANHLDGALSGQTWTASGKNGGALTFNANYVTVPDANALDLTSGMTIEAWVYPTVTLSGEPTVVLKETSGSTVYALYASGGANKPNAWIQNAGSLYNAEGGTKPAKNTWMHLAATYDAATAVLRVYTNGVLRDTHDLGTNVPIDTSTGALRLGGNAVWSGEWFRGRIDDVRIYSRALAGAEIVTDMNTPVAGDGGTGTGGTTGSGGTGGAGGTTGAAGTTGEAGTTGSAGTTGAAGSTDGGTDSGTDASAGTTGAAGTMGAAGAAGTTGTGGTSVPPIVEYKIDEAASGQAVTTLLDSQPSPLNSSIVYVGSTPQFAEDSNGMRALYFPAGDVKFAGAFSPALTSGNKLFTALNGSHQATLEVVADVDWLHNPAYIFQIFGVSQEDGENDGFMLWRWNYCTSCGAGNPDDRLEADFTTSAGYPSGYYKRSFAISQVTAGVHVFHVVFDSTQASAADRLRVFVDGTALTGSTPNEGGQTIPTSAVLAVIPPGGGHYQQVALGGYTDYAAGTGGYRGKIYYASIYSYAFVTADIVAAPARLIGAP